MTLHAERDIVRYRQEREEFFHRHGHRWPNTLADAFDILEPYSLERREVDEIRQTAGRLAVIYQRAGALLRKASDQTLFELGVPEYLWRSVRQEIFGMPDCVLGRFDLARTRSGYRMLEFNSDNPGFVVEAFSLNSAVCHEAGAPDPNHGCEAALRQALHRAVSAGLAHVGKSELDGNRANVVVTCSQNFGRDITSATYLCALLQPLPARRFPVEALQLDSRGLYDPGGRKIDVLVRGYSLKFIRNELFARREELLEAEMGGELLRLVETRQLALINPPAAFLLGNKAVQAAIWNLAERGLLFDDQEQQWVKHYMLPTYMDAPGDGAGYVIKPVHGAEGDTLTVVGAGGEVVLKSPNSTYSDEPMIYQQYVELPQQSLMTEYGPRHLHLVMSCFVVEGSPSAIFMRAGEAITDETAWVVPLCSLAG